jgi:site-specific DNA recombinase
LLFAFYGRVSTEDWQDPVTSQARQRAQADALVRGHGRVVREFFDAGQSRTVAWARWPQAAALVARWPTLGGAGTRSWSGSTSGRFTVASTR